MSGVEGGDGVLELARRALAALELGWDVGFPCEQVERVPGGVTAAHVREQVCEIGHRLDRAARLVGLLCGDLVGEDGAQALAPELADLGRDGVLSDVAIRGEDDGPGVVEFDRGVAGGESQVGERELGAPTLAQHVEVLGVHRDLAGGELGDDRDGLDPAAVQDGEFVGGVPVGEQSLDGARDVLDADDAALATRPISVVVLPAPGAAWTRAWAPSGWPMIAACSGVQSMRPGRPVRTTAASRPPAGRWRGNARWC